MSAATPQIPIQPTLDSAVLKVLTTGARPARASALSAVLAFGWRGMLKIKHVPEQLMDVTLMPVLMVFLFTYLFGGAIEGSTADYLQYLLPGLMVFVLFSSIYSGVALNVDVTKGVIDRFRSLPIPRPSPLIGAVLGDVVRYSVGVMFLVGIGLALGFRPEGGFVGVLAAGALVVVFASGLSWVFSTVGLLLRAPNAGEQCGHDGLLPAHLPQQRLRAARDDARLARGIRRRQPNRPPRHGDPCVHGRNSRWRLARGRPGHGCTADRRICAADHVPVPAEVGDLERRARPSRHRRRRRRARTGLSLGRIGDVPSVEKAAIEAAVA